MGAKTIVSCDGCGIELDEREPSGLAPTVTIGRGGYVGSGVSTTLCKTCRLTLLDRVADLYEPENFQMLRQDVER